MTLIPVVLLLSGCAGNLSWRDKGEEEHTAGDLRDALEGVTSALEDRLFAREERIGVGVLVHDNTQQHLSELAAKNVALLGRYLDSAVFSGAHERIVIDSTQLHSSMTSRGLLATAASVKNRSDVWHDWVGAEIVILHQLEESSQGDSLWLGLQAFDTRMGGKVVFDTTLSIESNYYVRKRLGQKTAGVVYVKSSFRNIWLETDVTDSIELTGKWEQVEVPLGKSKLWFSSDGCPPKVESVPVSDTAVNFLKVKRKQAGFATLGAFASSIIPALGSAIYESELRHGNGLLVANRASGFLTYMACGAYLADRAVGEEFLEWEIGIAAVSYLLNLITGYCIGNQYMKESRRLEIKYEVFPITDPTVYQLETHGTSKSLALESNVAVRPLFQIRLGM
jgi:hypothetical protein